MKSIWTFIRHNRGILISTVLVGILLFWAYSCQSKVRSITNPDTFVTRPELNAEVEHFLAQAQLKFADLDRQDEFKRLIFEAAITFVEEGTINPLAIIMTSSSILGIGAILDNQRKDVRIKTQKTNAVNKT